MFEIYCIIYTNILQDVQVVNMFLGSEGNSNYVPAVLFQSYNMRAYIVYMFVY